MNTDEDAKSGESKEEIIEEKHSRKPAALIDSMEDLLKDGPETELMRLKSDPIPV